MRRRNQCYFDTIRARASYLGEIFQCDGYMEWYIITCYYTNDNMYAKKLIT